jgi:hypothetical protein
MKSIAIAAFLIAGIAAPAAAETTAIELLRQCQGRGDGGEWGVLFCAGYFVGAIDAWAMAKGIAKQDFFCPPREGISAEQAKLIFEKWINARPAELHESARLHVLLAMKDAFPCRR